MVKMPRFLFPASVIGTCAGMAVLASDRRKNLAAKYDPEKKFSGRTVIVTGASSGIGKATALELARQGSRVIMACREYKSALKAKDEIVEETYNTNVEVKLLDLGSLDSIANFARDIHQNEKRLDVLINNAGVMQFQKKRVLTKDAFEMHLGVNYLGAFLLTNLLLPKLIQSQPSRVVNVVTSSMNSASINFDDLNSSKDYDPYHAYSGSKLALMSFTRSLNNNTKDDGVTAYAVYPGVTKTQLSRGLAKSTVSSAVFKPSELFMRTPEGAAQTVLWCTMEPGIEDSAAGHCVKDMKPYKWTSELSDTDSNRLWKISEVWTRLDNYRQSVFGNVQPSHKTTKS